MKGEKEKPALTKTGSKKRKEKKRKRVYPEFVATES